MPPTIGDVNKNKKSKKTSADDPRHIDHPKVRVEICSTPKMATQDDAIPSVTCAKMMEILGWETEDDYIARRIRADPKLKPEECKFDVLMPDGSFLNSLCTDMNGKLVICHHNTHNRDITMSDVMKYCQDVLTGNYMLNLETIIISKFGSVNSGQHRGVGLIFACQKWHKAKAKEEKDRTPEEKKWLEQWTEEPTMETLIAYGGEEDPKTLRTIDNVKSRTLTDVLSTSPVFAGKDKLSKKEMSRMLDNAIDLLWNRTGKKTHDSFQTHSASIEFFERHKRLADAVGILFDANVNRVISGHPIEMSAGQCSALLYLMGCCSTDPAQYFDANPPQEKHLSFSDWNKADGFWKLVGAKSPSMAPIGEALKLLTNENTLGGLTQQIKLATFVKAWLEYRYDGAITEENLKLQLSDPDASTGRRKLQENPIVGGIDQGQPVKEKEIEPTDEEIEAAKEIVKAKRAKAIQDKVTALRAGQGTTVVPKAGDKVVVPPTAQDAIDKAKADTLKARIAAARLNQTPAQPAPQQLVTAGGPLKGGV